MKMLKFLKLFLKTKGKSHPRRKDKSHQDDVEQIPKKTEVVSGKKTAKQRCPLCKNHCDLNSPRCKRGKEYAKKK